MRLPSLHARATGVVLVLAAVLPLTTTLQAQGGERPAHRQFADSSCLTGRACRLALVDLAVHGRRRRSELMLVRGLGRDERVLGPAWERIDAVVGADTDAHALALKALRGRARARRRHALVYGGGVAISVATALVVARRSAPNDPTLGLASIARGVIAAIPVSLVTSLVAITWSDAAHRESVAALEDAVTVWNRRVDPPRP